MCPSRNRKCDSPEALTFQFTGTGARQYTYAIHTHISLWYTFRADSVLVLTYIMCVGSFYPRSEMKIYTLSVLIYTSSVSHCGIIYSIYVGAVPIILNTEVGEYGCQSRQRPVALSRPRVCAPRKWHSHEVARRHPHLQISFGRTE